MAAINSFAILEANRRAMADWRAAVSDATTAAIAAAIPVDDVAAMTDEDLERWDELAESSIDPYDVMRPAHTLLAGALFDAALQFQREQPSFPVKSPAGDVVDLASWRTRRPDWQQQRQQ